MTYYYRIVDNKGIVVAEDESKNMMMQFLKILKNYHGNERTFKLYPVKVQQNA
jgi:hypothetical protein